MENIEFSSGTTVIFDDSLRRDGKTVGVKIIKQFKKGKAVFINLDAKELKILIEEYNKLQQK